TRLFPRMAIGSSSHRPGIPLRARTALECIWKTFPAFTSGRHNAKHSVAVRSSPADGEIENESNGECASLEITRNRLHRWLEDSGERSHHIGRTHGPLTGACPGPLFALVGSGVTVMIVAIISALAGTWLYGPLR